MTVAQLVEFSRLVMESGAGKWPDSATLSDAARQGQIFTPDQLKQVSWDDLNALLQSREFAARKNTKKVSVMSHPAVYRRGGYFISLVGKRAVFVRKDVNSEFNFMEFKDSPPILPRQYFEPAITSGMILGEWKKAESVTEDWGRGSWTADQVLTNILEEDPDQFMRRMGFERLPGCYIATGEVRTTRNLEQLCRKLLETPEKIGGSIQSLVSPISSTVVPAAPLGLVTPSGAVLTRSQLEAHMETSRAGQDRVVQVQGPPGTGKTRLITSIVAEQLFQAMVAQSPFPVIAISSINNGAVDNALAALAPPRPGWSLIEFLSETLGLRCISTQREAQCAHGHLVSSTKDWPKAVENILRDFKMVKKGALSKTAEFYSASAGSWAAAAGAIRGEAMRKAKAISNQNAITEQYRLDRQKLWVHILRYWQLRALAECETHLANMENRDDSDGYLVKWWKVVGPLFAAAGITLHMLPRWANYEIRGIDLLIIDEAGQCSPWLAIPNLALSKLTCIVGDPLQLEPVLECPPSVVRRMWSMAKLPDSEFDRCELPYSSVMSMAGTPGKKLMLKDCFRCPPDVVQAVNVLCYEGQLMPMKKSDGQAIHWVKVEGLCEKEGKSRVNRQEAQAISAWLEKYEAHILSLTGKPSIRDAVVILAPFRAQADLIRNVVPEGITVGTVHVMQGREADIVLFSAVYNRWEEAGMLKSRPNLINVALTRSQKRFFWFGKFLPEFLTRFAQR